MDDATPSLGMEREHTEDELLKRREDIDAEGHLHLEDLALEPPREGRE